MEKVFKGPKVILDRMCVFDVHRVAEADPEEFAALVSTPPAIHRFPCSMAKRLQVLAQFLVEHYDGKVESIWKRGKPDGVEHAVGVLGDEDRRYAERDLPLLL